MKLAQRVEQNTWPDGIAPCYRLSGSRGNWEIRHYIGGGKWRVVENWTVKRKALKSLNDFYRWELNNN